MTVDWNGNAWFAGDVYVGDGSNPKKLMEQINYGTSLPSSGKVGEIFLLIE